MKPPEPKIIEECQTNNFYNKTDDFDKITAKDDANAKFEVQVNVVTAPMSKKRKFSFKHGKMSVTETSPTSVNPDNIYLEVQGKEIEVSEECLLSNSQHFSRVLEDISINNNSEYLMKNDNQETEDDDEDDNHTFSSVSFESVSTVVDFIAKRISDLDLSEANVSKLQHVARLLGVTSVEKLCKKFVKSGLTVSNCFSRFSLADSFLGWSDTSSLIQTFIEFHFSDILETNLDELCSKLNEVQLKRILSSPNLHTKSEDEVAEAILAWVGHDPEARAECLPPLMDEVQFQCLSGVKIVRKLLDDVLIHEDAHSLEILEQALEYHNLNYDDKVSYWQSQPCKPSRWPQLLVCLSYAEKILQCLDFVTGTWSVLTEKPDWVFGAELAYCDQRLFTLGGVSSRQVDVYCPESDTWSDGSYPALRRSRLSHGVGVAPSGHGGVIYTAGGSAEVGGAGHSDLEWVEPGLPSECDCTLCGPTDHIKWQLEAKKMTGPRTFAGMTVAEVGGESVVVVVGGDQDPDTRVSSVEIFNRRRGTWSQGPHTLARRDCCRLTVVDGNRSKINLIKMIFFFQITCTLLAGMTMSPIKF